MGVFDDLMGPQPPAASAQTPAPEQAKPGFLASLFSSFTGGNQKAAAPEKAAPTSVYDQLMGTAAKTPQPAKTTPPASADTKTPPESGGGVFEQLMGKPQAPAKYFAAVDKTGNSFGVSDEHDISGVPYFAYRAPGDTATTTDKTRLAFRSDPRLATSSKPIDTSAIRMTQSRSSALRKDMGALPNEQLDHDTSLELGGSNDPSNLRLEQNVAGTNNTPTDPEENALAKKVSAGDESLFQAQVDEAKMKGTKIPFTGEQKKPGVFEQLMGAGKDLAGQVGGLFSDAYTGAKQSLGYDVPVEGPVNGVASPGPNHPARSFDANYILQGGADTLANTITDGGNRLANMFATFQDQHATALDKGISVEQAGMGVLNGMFSIITAPLASMARYPGLGVVADGINDLFTALGGAGSKIALNDVLKKLPVDQATKDKLSQPVSELGALIGQLVAGKAGDEVIPEIAQHAQRITQAFADYSDAHPELQKGFVKNPFVDGSEQQKPLPLNHPAALTETDAIGQYHADEAQKPQRVLEDLKNAEDKLAELNKEIEAMPAVAEQHTPEQRTTIETARSLQNYLTENEDYRKYWSAKAPGDVVTRAERKASEPPTPKETALYRAQYNSDVKDAIQKGYRVPDEVIKQAAQFKKAAAARERFVKGRTDLMKNSDEEPTMAKEQKTAGEQPVEPKTAETAGGELVPAKEMESMKVMPLDKALKKFDETGSVVVAQKPGMRLIVKDEGDYVKVGLDTGSLESTDIKRPSRVFATKEEAFSALKDLLEKKKTVSGGKYPTIHEGGIIKMVDGEPVKIIDGVETFLHKGDGGWIVSEASTGRVISESRSSEGAIAKAHFNIDNAGKDKFLELLKEHKLDLSNKIETTKVEEETEEMPVKSAASSPDELVKNIAAETNPAKIEKLLEQTGIDTQQAPGLAKALSKMKNESDVRAAIEGFDPALERRDKVPMDYPDHVKDLAVEIQTRKDNIASGHLTEDELDRERTLVSELQEVMKSERSKVMETRRVSKEERAQRKQEETDRRARIKDAAEKAAKALADEAEQERIRKEKIEDVLTSRGSVLDKRAREKLFTKLKNALTPMRALDAVSRKIYRQWEYDKMAAREAANDVIRQFDDPAAGGGFQTILDYEAGTETPHSDTIRDTFTSMRDEGIKRGLDVAWRDNYIPHKYDNTPEEVESAIYSYLNDKGLTPEQIRVYMHHGAVLPDALARSLKVNPSFTKERFFPDYKTAMAHGLTPKYSNWVQHAAYYRGEMEHTLANTKVVQAFIDEAKLLDTSIAPRDWDPVKVPFAQRGMSAEPHLATILNDKFGNVDRVGFDGLVRAIFHYGGKLNHAWQHLVLSTGVPGTVVHAFSIGMAFRDVMEGIGGVVRRGDFGGFKAASAIFRANFNDGAIESFKRDAPYIKMLADRGVDLSGRIGNWEEAYDNIFTHAHAGFWESLIGVPKSLGRAGGELGKGEFRAAGRATKTAGRFTAQAYDRVFTRKTFRSFIPMRVISVFKDAYAAGLKEGMDATKAADFAADVTKKDLGMIEKLGREKGTSDALTTIFFAPPYREGILNMLWNSGKSVLPEELGGGLHDPTLYKNRDFVIGTALSFALFQALNQSLNGTFTWQNGTGHEFALKIPYSSDKWVYIEFGPSLFTIPRSLAEGTIAFAKGDAKTGVQKLGTLFSIPIKTASEVLTNSDFFGHQIYKPTDPAGTRAEKIALYLGTGANAPIVAQTLKFLTDQKKAPLLQYVNNAFGFILKFSSAAQENAQLLFQMTQAATQRNADANAKVQPIYDQVQQLIKDGDKTGAQKLVDDLSDDDYAAYKRLKTADTAIQTRQAEAKMVPVYKQVQELIKDGRTPEAEAIINALSDSDYKAYKLVKARGGTASPTP